MEVWSVEEAELILNYVLELGLHRPASLEADVGVLLLCCCGLLQYIRPLSSRFVGKPSRGT